ncbi:sensor histidine kinase [Paenibacillus sp. CMAA1364]
MQKWYQSFLRSTGLSPYVWVVFFILPFYFIFRSSSPIQITTGIVMTFVFLGCYVLSFITKGWPIYIWTSVQIVISISMTLLFGYVYFAVFLALFIGNIQNKSGFITLYCVHLVTTFISINYGFFTQGSLFITQFPFIIMSLIGVILLPVNTYNRNKNDKLQDQLEDANKRISDLVKLEERQRIARDLHDTLGQKLSLIGLKSDLASKLMTKDITKAQVEINDVRQTARSALKEVREMVTEMRGSRVEDEVFRVSQILKAAEIEYSIIGDPILKNTSLLTENVLSMCLKEAVTNVVKHSEATKCIIAIEPTGTDLVISVQDNGVGMDKGNNRIRGNGLRGMMERLEFVNGTLEIVSDNGTNLIITVPNVIKNMDERVEV